MALTDYQKQNYTYSGNTVQDFLNAGGAQTNAGGYAWSLPQDHPDYNSSGGFTTDQNVYGNLANPMYGGKSPYQYLTSLGVDPTNMGAAVPDPLKGSLIPTGPDAFGMMLGLGGMGGLALSGAMAGAGAAGSLGAEGATGASALGSAGGDAGMFGGLADLEAANPAMYGQAAGEAAASGAPGAGWSLSDLSKVPTPGMPGGSGGDASWGVNPQNNTEGSGVGLDDMGGLGASDSGGSGGFMDWLAKVSPDTWIRLGGGVLGAGIGALGATSAANAQKDAANQANSTLLQMYNQNRADLAPWREAGVGALGTMRDLTTPGKQFDTAMLDPGYAFRQSEGAKGIDRGAAARGRYFTPATMMALDRYNQNFATNEFGNVYNRLSNLAGLGQVGTTAGVNAGQNYANNAANINLGAGNARASGYMGVANALGGGVGSVGNTLSEMAMLDYLRNRG